MTRSKIKIVAGLQFAAAVLTALVGYFVLYPRFGRWGVVFTSLAAAVAVYWLTVLLAKGRFVSRSLAHTTNIRK